MLHIVRYQGVSVTHVIAVITHKFVVLASDRRLTRSDDPEEVIDDDTCKLVSHCNMSGIGYTGWADLEGKPTHEWIARELAKAKVTNSLLAAQIIQRSANRALARGEVILQQFLFAGWAPLLKNNALELWPYFELITNSHDKSGTPKTPGRTFERFNRFLTKNEPFRVFSLGSRILKKRQNAFNRRLRQLVKRDVSAAPVIRTLVAEIIANSGGRVGDRVLCFCIPKASADIAVRTRKAATLIDIVTEDRPSFFYFNCNSSKLVSYAPTYVCGGMGQQDNTLETDEKTGAVTFTSRIIRPSHPSR